MKYLAVLVGFALVVSAEESRTERGDRVVKEALAALGGDKFLAMKDRVESGRAYSFYRERISGLARTKIYTRYLTRPEPPKPGFFGVRVRQAMGKDEDSAVVFLEDRKGWSITYRGARPIPDAEVQRFEEGQLRNIFYIFRMRMGEPGMIFESNGTEIVDNQQCEVVDITDADNRVVTVWFHHLTKLPMRQRSFRRTGEYRDEEVTIFSKYRDVGDGVHWPYTWHRSRNGEVIFEMFADSVVINQDLSDVLFTISADTKILKKK